MPGLLSGLVRAAVAGGGGYLAGNAEREQRDRAQRMQDMQLLLQQHAMSRQDANDAESQSRQRAADALNGILTGQAPTTAGIDLSQAAGVGTLPGRYQQVTPDRYVDEMRTPQARAEQAYQRTRSDHVADVTGAQTFEREQAANAEKVRTALAAMQERAANQRLGAEHGYRMEEIAAQPRAWRPETEQDALDFAQKTATARAAGKPAGGVPPKIQEALTTNQSALRAIDAAIAAVKTHPDAFGPSNMLGGSSFKNQLSPNPDAIAARAAVADIGSLTIHERTGAAMGRHEWERLAPFIASETDNPQTALAKLGQFRARVLNETQGLQQTYGGRQDATNVAPAGGAPTGASGNIDLRAGGGPAVPFATRVQQLRAQGLAPDAAKAKLRAEGYAW